MKNLSPMNQTKTVMLLSRVVVSFSLLFLLTLTGNAQNIKSASRADQRKEVIKAVHAFYDEWGKGNRAVLERLLADDFIETDIFGELHDKDWNLTNLVDQNVPLTYNITNEQVRIHQNTAVVCYVFSNYFGSKQETQEQTLSNLQVTDIFQKRGTQWQLIASHRTLLAQVKIPHSTTPEKP